MKIYKDTFEGFDGQSAIESEIQKAVGELKVRYGIDLEPGQKPDNFPFESAQWAREIAEKIVNGNSPELEYIDKTKAEEDQEKADGDQLAADTKAEEDRNTLLVQAQTDPVIRNKLIRSEMSKAGFTPEEIILKKVAKEWDGEDITEFKLARATAKQNIIDMINSA